MIVTERVPSRRAPQTRGLPNTTCAKQTRDSKHTHEVLQTHARGSPYTQRTGSRNKTWPRVAVSPKGQEPTRPPRGHLGFRHCLCLRLRLRLGVWLCFCPRLDLVCPGLVRVLVSASHGWPVGDDRSEQGILRWRVPSEVEMIHRTARSSTSGEALDSPSVNSANDRCEYFTLFDHRLAAANFSDYIPTASS